MRQRHRRSLCSTGEGQLAWCIGATHRASSGFSRDAFDKDNPLGRLSHLRIVYPTAVPRVETPRLESVSQARNQLSLRGKCQRRNYTPNYRVGKLAKWFGKSPERIMSFVI